MSAEVPAGDWSQLSAGLTQVLGALPDGAVLELEDATRSHGGYYVQLWQDPDALHAEISAVAEVDDAEPLADATGNRIGALGFNPPEASHPAHWWIDLDWPAPGADYAELATRLLAVLRDVFGVGTPAELTYRAWQAGTGAAVELPELGLPRRSVEHYARLGHGDTLDRPGGLLRRTRTGDRVADEALHRDGHWRPSETLERAELGELDDELIEINAGNAAMLADEWRADAAEVAQLGGAGDPVEGELRLAGAVDADRDPAGRPIVHNGHLAEQQRAGVASYLREAPIVVAAYGFDPDPFDASGAEVVPLHIHTDGQWVWSESLAYFADRYGIAPEPDLVAHIERQRYRWPEVDDAVLERAARLVSP